MKGSEGITGLGKQLSQKLGLTRPNTAPQLTTEDHVSLAETHWRTVKGNVLQSLATPASIDRGKVPEASPEMVGRLAKSLPTRVQERITQMQTTETGRTQLQQIEDTQDVVTRFSQYMQLIGTLGLSRQETKIVQQLFVQLANQTATSLDMKGRGPQAIDSLMNAMFLSDVSRGVGISEFTEALFWSNDSVRRITALLDAKKGLDQMRKKLELEAQADLLQFHESGAATKVEVASQTLAQSPVSNPALGEQDTITPEQKELLDKMNNARTSAMKRNVQSDKKELE